MQEPANDEAFLAPLNLNDDRPDEAPESRFEVSADVISAIVNLTPNQGTNIRSIKKYKPCHYLEDTKMKG